MRRQLSINLRYCYSAGRATQNVSAKRDLLTIAIQRQSQRAKISFKTFSNVFNFF